MNKKLKKILIIIFWIAVWAVVAIVIGSPLILASPADVTVSILNMLVTAKFWATVACSFLRIGIGFICACLIGSIMGVLSYKFETFYDFISPIIHLIKSAPLVCIIVLLLVWFGVWLVDIIAVSLAVIPVFFFAILTACKERNIKILNMLKIYKVPSKTIWNVFEWPAIMPYFYQATQTGIGLSWKSGTTAQMIGAVGLTIGEGVYMSKLMLDSAQLLIWMFVVVFLGWTSEKLLILVIKKLSNVQTISSIKAVSKNTKINKDEKNNLQITDYEANKTRDNTRHSQTSSQAIVKLENISKSFTEKKLIQNFNLKLMPGDKIAFVCPIGTGKSTLINIMLGLDKKISGRVKQIKTDKRVYSVVFQENTLSENLSVQDNIKIAAQVNVSPDSAKELTGSNSLANKLSGGMKRCAEIERAIIAESAAVIMDEPFAGLDVNTKKQATNYINDNLNGRALVLATHDAKDAEALQCKVLSLQINNDE